LAFTVAPDQRLPPTIELMADEPPDIAEREEALRTRALEELPELALADKTTRLLCDLIQRTPVDATKMNPTASELQHHALWLMAISGHRTLRAAMHVLSVGYEDQAAGYQRVIDELWSRAQKVRSDASGSYASRWVEGKPPGKAAKLTEQDVWEFWSKTQHADPDAVRNWVAVPQEDGSVKIILGPERRPDITRGTLTLMIVQVRDLAGMLAAQTGAAVPGLDALTAEIDEARQRHGLLDEGEE
jgi:hypothetical protein